ncbi:YetF domain-containing protein [Alkalicoccobacillus gibsonii]|uniref:YetF domain-containing protein n=1 Tax=Alkalicoccobacillus gibsonii TaxID=79881 RepID=A0ABU9VH91_9BACI
MVHQLTLAIATFSTLSLFQLMNRTNQFQPLLILSFTFILLLLEQMVHTPKMSIVLLLLSLLPFIYLIMVKLVRAQTALEPSESLYTNSVPMPVIMDGQIQHAQLKQIDQNEFWLRRQVRDHGFKDIKRISYCSVRGDQLFYIDVKDKK